MHARTAYKILGIIKLWITPYRLNKEEDHNYTDVGTCNSIHEKSYTTINAPIL